MKANFVASPIQRLKHGVIQSIFVLCLSHFFILFVSAHSPSTTYLANESILVQNGDTKVLFDPFFHQDFGQYQLVPEQILNDIFAGKSPYDGIDAIVISHAHGDHFAADIVLKYLRTYSKTVLIAPQQAIDALNVLPESDSVSIQLRPIKLDFNDDPKQVVTNSIIAEGVRIPHAGWPARADIENLVFRVTLENEGQDSITVMHMGDADPEYGHFLPFKSHWQSRKTHMAFPPYWFYFSYEGNYIMDEFVNAQQHIGIHVPIKVPEKLIKTGKRYFTTPSETADIDTSHAH